LKAFIEEQPHIYHDEMVDFIAEEFDVDVSLITVSRSAKGEDITKKGRFVSAFHRFVFLSSLLIVIAKNSQRTLRISSV